MVDRGQFPAVSAGRLRRRVLHDGPHVSLMIVGYAGGDWHTHIDGQPALRVRKDTVHSAEKRFNLEVLGDFWVRGSTGHIAGAIPHWISSGTGLAAQTLDALLICRSFNDGDQTPATIGADAKACYAAIANAIPGLPVIVAGVEP